MLLPILVMVFTGLAGMTRTVRAAMMDTLSEDYIRTARAKGLKEKVVIYSHAWRNALLPVSTSIMGWMIGVFTGGSLVIENTFGLNGTGGTYYTALINKDFELALSLQLFYTLIGLFGVLLTDISYTLVDPRVRIDK
jgi:peptide/nickel transport system permease protein